MDVANVQLMHLEGPNYGSDSEDEHSSNDNKFQEFISENLKLKEELKEEKMKWLKIEDRYNYLEQNYIEFTGLKEEYMKLTNDRLKMDETAKCSSKSSQTWDSIICEFCKSTTHIASQDSFKKFIECQKDESICIKRNYLMELQSKFVELKQKIQELELQSKNSSEILEIAKLKGINTKTKSVMRELLSKYKQERNKTKLLQRIVAGYKTEQKLTLQEELFINKIKSDLVTPECAEATNYGEQTTTETDQDEEKFISELNRELLETSASATNPE